jgi:hypothetical protein
MEVSGQLHAPGRFTTGSEPHPTGVGLLYTLPNIKYNPEPLVAMEVKHADGHDHIILLHFM